MKYNKYAVYWIFIQQVLSQGNPRLVPLLHRFGNAKAVYECTFEEIKEAGILTRGELERFKKVTIEQCYDIIDQCSNLGYQIITPNDSLYPNRLAQIINPPAVLYVKGEFPKFDDQVAVAMVGTRKCSENGKAIARELSRRLTEAGVLVVSGGAKGIDASAHIGALRAGGKTYAVLGCGINYPYLHINEGLRRDIAENGALISEYPPNAPSGRHTFPIRNRIISGLCLGTVVVEAIRGSGSLITVDHALDQGRDIFVIPGEVSDPLYEGSNKLIRDGAIAVLTPADILREYNNVYPHRLDLTGAELPISFSDAPFLDVVPEAVPTVSQTQNPTEKRKAQADLSKLSDDARLLYERFSESGEDAFDVVAASDELPSARAISALSELEIIGYIKALPGGRYTLS